MLLTYCPLKKFLNFETGLLRPVAISWLPLEIARKWPGPLPEVSVVQQTSSSSTFSDNILSWFSSWLTSESKLLATHDFPVFPQRYTPSLGYLLLSFLSNHGLFPSPLCRIGTVSFSFHLQSSSAHTYLVVSRCPTSDHIRNLKLLHTMAHCDLHQKCTHDARSH